MTQEEKQLLLKDLCARLPYNVLIRCTDNDTNYKCFLTADILNELLHNIEYYDYKPYLRPLESMTEEETKEINKFLGYRKEINAFGDIRCAGWNGDVFVDIDKIYGYLNWLNEHHFDYHGLIEKGLALEAKEGMYKNE